MAVTIPELVEQLTRISRQAAGVDLHPFEERDAQTVCSELVPSVLRVAEEALAVLDQVLQVFEAAAVPGQGDVPTAPSPVERERAVVADLAFVARLELRQQVGGLRSLEAGDSPWPMLALCESCLHKVGKATQVVEGALGVYLDKPPRLSGGGDADVSREVRRRYARLRHDVLQAERRYRDDPRARLRGAATALSRLMVDGVYRKLRISDRAQLRRLQARLAVWLRGGGDEAEDDDGEHLWQDIMAVVRLLSQVNQRADLVHADRELVAACLEELERRRQVPTLPGWCLQSLEDLRGRDETVDALLDVPVTPAAVWQSELQRLLTSLR